MKKFSFVLAAVLLIATGLSLTSCLSTSSLTSSSTKTTTIKMYDNCPQDTYALAAELALKVTNSSYTGTTTYSFKGTPSTDAIKPVATYYGYCYGIKEAIAKGSGKTCTLSFNTKANGAGVKLDFSGTDEIITSLLKMAVNNYTSVYAIYKY
ncbi:MAG: hypothetical protein WCQ67_08470 [Treponema sp.]